MTHYPFQHWKKEATPHKVKNFVEAKIPWKLMSLVDCYVELERHGILPSCVVLHPSGFAMFEKDPSFMKEFNPKPAGPVDPSSKGMLWSAQVCLDLDLPEDRIDLYGLFYDKSLEEEFLYGPFRFVGGVVCGSSC